MRKQKMKPIHPGEVLIEDYLKPLGMSQNALAKAIGVPADRISEIVRGRRGITGDTAVRLAHYFNTTPDLWSGLQADYEIELALDRLGPRLNKMPQVNGSTKNGGSNRKRFWNLYDSAIEKTNKKGWTPLDKA